VKNISGFSAMTNKEKNIAHRIKNKIKEKDSSAEIILYGSHARGNVKKDSDWDILILLNKRAVTLKTEQEFRHYLFDLELEIGEPISIYVYSKKKWESLYSISPLYKSIKNEGISLA